MDRRVFVSAMVAFVLTMWNAAAMAEPQSSTPARLPTAGPTEAGVDCEGYSTVVEDWPGRQAVIRVRKDATVDFPCSKIVKGSTRVTWIGEKGVERLTIGLKSCKPTADPGDLPDNPACKENMCVLEREQHEDQTNKKIRVNVCYHVFVENDDKTRADKDPKLIIRPPAH